MRKALGFGGHFWYATFLQKKIRPTLRAQETDPGGDEKGGGGEAPQQGPAVWSHLCRFPVLPLRVPVGILEPSGQVRASERGDPHARGRCH